jgi:hypothetical protein
MDKIEALQMCLEYIETNKHERKYVRHAIKAALAQPVQEPVTCRFCHSKKGSWAWQCYKCGEIDDVQQPAAQRPWQGLTEKDIPAINQSCLTKFQAAMSAESILKERNT